MSEHPSSSASGCGSSCGCNSSQQNDAAAQKPGKLYWRSLDDLSDTPEFRAFMHNEFPAGAADLLSSSDRRSFLKVMGASLALAGVGMSGCRRWPDEKIAPFAHRPANRTPGIPVQYATSMEIGGVSSALLATSYDGRPIKNEGNPQHPISNGATDVYAQASILDLYDPDRSQAVLHQSRPSTWVDFLSWAKSHFAANRAGVAVLSEATSSPSVLAMKQRLMQAFPGAAWHEYEPINNDNQVNGAKLAFGSAQRPHYNFGLAKTIVALDSDFLHCDAGGINWTRDYANARRVQNTDANPPRLYSFESGVSLTGANADHRISMRSSDVALVAARLAAQLVPAASGALGELGTAPIAAVDSRQADEAIANAIADLKTHDRPSIVIAGPRQPAEVHLLVHLINQALGNIGKTITFTPMPEAVGQSESLRSLLSNMAAGKVQTLIVLGGNPVYNAPADLKFADALKGVPNTIHLSSYADETSQLCTWHVNRAHYLEAWGDGRAYDGSLTITQPLIEPLFGGKSDIELLAAITGDELTQGYDIVRRTFGQTAGGTAFEPAWRSALHDGFVANSAIKAGVPALAAGQDLGQQLQPLRQNRAAPKSNELEVVFATDVCLYDGRFANNGWLQEMPDPIGKLTWDNAVQISPEAARSRGLKNGDMITLNVGGRQIEAPIIIIPGQYTGSATLNLGYGRSFEGRVCKGAGFNFYTLRGSEAMGFAQAEIAVSGGHYPLAITQDHYAIDTVGGQGVQERLPTLFREASLDEYRHHPDFAAHRMHVVHRLSLWDEKLPFHNNDSGREGRYAWAMSIDLSACTGCSACVIACQAENNIPIVGKDQVKRGREMHWIRIDRYFKGYNQENPEGFVLAPVPCMHCENAPCEQVCPVAATTHDDQGLNVMVYNRCIGTRYCSNNCPYKVRRFNYFDYHARDPHREQPGVLLQVEPEYYGKKQATPDALKQLQFNPEVTVRMRGIMEKCTYCVQRITKARIEAKNNWVRAKNLNENDPAVKDVRVPIADGTVTPACAQACPAQAIVFGDLHDPNSRVSQLHRHERTYQMLEELNPKPRTRYMAKIRNPHVPAGSAEHQPGAHG